MSDEKRNLIRVVIAEDETHSRERLKEMIGEFPGLLLTGEAGDGLTAVQLIDTLKPDLAFLDIRMPGVDGFQVLEKISHQPHVVFITAYDSYAIKAFEENAVDYILKPFSSERLARTVQRVRDLQKTPEQGADLLQTLKTILRAKEYTRRFAVKMGDDILIIPENEVFYFQAENKCVMLYTDTKKYFIEATLKELEQSIDPNLFLRIHKSAIVSLDRIEKLKKWFHSEWMVQLNDSGKTKLKVSRGFQSALKERLKI